MTYPVFIEENTTSDLSKFSFKIKIIKMILMNLTEN